jgi:hypothetical protein
MKYYLVNLSSRIANKPLIYFLDSGEDSPANIYTSMAAMFLDSYALYAIWYLISVIILMALRLQIPGPFCLVFAHTSVYVKVSFSFFLSWWTIMIFTVDIRSYRIYLSSIEEYGGGRGSRRLMINLAA